MSEGREWQRESTARQLSQFLREELARGRWSATMPGVIRLAGDFGVSRDSVEAALAELEREGLLRAQGRGKKRLIVAEGMSAKAPALRVVVLLGEPADQSAGHFVELIHALREAGHHAEFAPKTQIELGYKAARIARLVKSTPADAWLIFSGAREVLEWFAAAQLPAFAFAGRSARVPIPSIVPDKMTPTRIAIRRLVELGHRKIVLLCRPHRVVPEPGLFERAFVDELEAQGITTGPYHLQTWDETAEGYQKALDSLFRFTPPTALFVEESPFVTVVFQYCMKRGLKVPDDFSLICTDPDPTFQWCRPSIAHIAWDSRQLIRRVVGWAENLRFGKTDLKKGSFKARLVEGDTIGPAKGG